MKIIINKPRWQKLEHVPELTLNWAKLIVGEMVNINDVNDLVMAYEDWLDQNKL